MRGRCWLVEAVTQRHAGDGREKQERGEEQALASAVLRHCRGIRCNRNGLRNAWPMPGFQGGCPAQQREGESTPRFCGELRPVLLPIGQLAHAEPRPLSSRLCRPPCRRNIVVIACGRMAVLRRIGVLEFDDAGLRLDEEIHRTALPWLGLCLRCLRPSIGGGSLLACKMLDGTLPCRRL